jgi:hypothetical protein
MNQINLNFISNLSGSHGGERGIRTHGTESGISGPSSDYLLRNDWLSSLIGALLLATWNG